MYRTAPIRYVEVKKQRNRFLRLQRVRLKLLARKIKWNSKHDTIRGVYWSEPFFRSLRIAKFKDVMYCKYCNCFLIDGNICSLRGGNMTFCRTCIYVMICRDCHFRRFGKNV